MDTPWAAPRQPTVKPRASRGRHMCTAWGVCRVSMEPEKGVAVVSVGSSSATHEIFKVRSWVARGSPVSCFWGRSWRGVSVG